MSCLDSLTLAAWVEGTLAAADRARALSHIADCAVCREVVSALTLAAQDSSEGNRRGGPEGLAPTPGAMLGRYQVEGVVASGGMGVVLTAIDPHLQRKVAIKIRRPAARAQAPKLEARLIQEARALAQIRHPNVVAVHDADRDGDHLFVVMELVEGESLRAWLGRRHPWQAGLRIAIEAGRGLEALHAAGLAHRDVKPDNILLAADGRVLLADLGLAVQTAGADHPPLTLDGAVVGTPRYLAPEQLAGNRGDPRSDQFSFAVVLREVLAASDEPPPAWLRAVIQRAMDPDPIHRFASLTELLAALGRRPRRHRAVVIAAAAAGAAALAWRVWPGRASEPPAERGPGPLAAAPIAVALDAAPPRAVALDAAAALAAAAPALGPDAGAPAAPVADAAIVAGAPGVAATPRGPQRATASVPPRNPPAPASSLVSGNADRASRAARDPSDPPRSAKERALQQEEDQRFGVKRFPATYDARRFQPSAYFAKAQEMARAAASDAELIGATFVPVARDGSVDLELADKLRDCRFELRCGVNVYFFRSPSRSKQSADIPPNVQLERECAIGVFVYAHTVLVEMLPTTACQDPGGPPPRCTLAQIWAAALGRGAQPDAAAQVQWDPEDGWGFSTKLSARIPDHYELTLPDQCGGPAAPGAPR